MGEMAKGGTEVTYEIVSVLCGGPGFTAPGENLNYRQLDNRCNDYTPCALYQKALETSKSDIIIYAHDDVVITDPGWLDRVLYLFSPPTGVSHNSRQNVVAVGLGGATGLGNANLYRKPYDICNLARHDYASNQVDAETHGERYGGSRRVAVLDAFLMVVRRDFLMHIGGWPERHLTHHCLDLWLACEAARHDKEIWMVGAACHHLGGRTSTLPAYKDARWLAGGSLELDHQLPHAWLYTKYRDVLPIEVPA